ncbi:hypothetical protein B0H66DRAFT_618914, partial [Apodospora peruviana]
SKSKEVIPLARLFHLRLLALLLLLLALPLVPLLVRTFSKNLVVLLGRVTCLAASLEVLRWVTKLATHHVPNFLNIVLQPGRTAGVDALRSEWMIALSYVLLDLLAALVTPVDLLAHLGDLVMRVFLERGCVVGRQVRTMESDGLVMWRCERWWPASVFVCICAQRVEDGQIDPRQRLCGEQAVFV